METEEHPLGPFLPANARLLMLGSFPPPRAKWSMEFFYPNFINDMWRIFGLVFFGDRERFVAAGGKRFDRGAIEGFLRGRGIALYDAAKSVRRLNNNASDKFLEVAEPVCLEGLLSEIPHCSAVAATGQKAVDVVSMQLGVSAPPVGGFVGAETGGRRIELWRMPSSSRAYPKPLSEKAEVYARMFAALGML